MLFFGHLGIAIFIASFIALPLIFAGIGVLLPDLLDKPLFILGLTPCSRFIGHTLFFGAVVFSFVYFTTKNKKIALTLLFGILLHLIQDFQSFVPYFYPFVSYSFTEICQQGPYTLHPTNLDYLFELIGLALLIFVLYRRKNGKLKSIFSHKLLDSERRRIKEKIPTKKRVNKI